MSDARTTELVRLIERESDQASEFIRSVVGTTSTMRGWSVTAWLAVLGVAIDKGSAGLALLAGFVVLPFALLDLYHSWLYSEALNHVRALEKVSAAYFSMVELGEDDEDLELDFEAKVGAFKFGLYRNFKKFQLSEVRRARPGLVFRLFYPGLIIGAFAIAAAIAFCG
jgi:hypothetical protein